MFSQKLPFDKAYAMVKEARSVAGINRGFELQLRAYSLQYNVYFAQQLLLRYKLNILLQLREDKAFVIPNDSSEDNNFPSQNIILPTNSSTITSKATPRLELPIINTNLSESITPSPILTEILSLPSIHSESSKKNLITSSPKSQRSLQPSISRLDSHGSVLSISSSSSMDIPRNQLLASIDSNHDDIRNSLSNTNSPFNIKERPHSPRKGIFIEIMNKHFPLFSSKSPKMNITQPKAQANNIEIINISIPSLRGLDREYCCLQCNYILFSLKNIIQIDSKIDLNDYQDCFQMLQSNNTSNLPSSLMKLKEEEELEDLDVFDINTNKFNTSTGSLNPLAYDRFKSSSSSSSFSIPPPTSRHSCNKSSFFNSQDSFELSDSYLNSPMSKGSKLIDPSIASMSISSPTESLSTCTSKTSQFSFPSTPPPNSLQLITTIDIPILEYSPKNISTPNKYTSSSNQISNVLLDEDSLWSQKIYSFQEFSKNQIDKIIEDDIFYDSILTSSNSIEEYIYIEYMNWMSSDLLCMDQDFDDITCPNCMKIIGHCLWKPSLRQCLQGKVNKPLFRIHKKVISKVSYLFYLYFLC